MPVDFELRKYPICDADIWIKLCKLDMHNEVFDEYEKLFFADVVIQELRNKAKDEPENLGCGIENLKEKSSYIHKMGLNSSFFNSKERKQAKRLFVDNQIKYEDNQFLDERQPHLGETVSLIYASIQKLDVMLSDDSGSKEESNYIRNRFKRVNVINFKELMSIRGIDDKKAELLRDISSNYLDKEKAKESLVKGSLKDLRNLKYGLWKQNKI